MAPLKSFNKLSHSNNCPAITTRSKTIGQTKDTKRGKRKAENSPPKEPSLKRSALGDVTNKTKADEIIITNKNPKKVTRTNSNATKKVTISSKILPSVKTAVKVKNIENLGPPPAPAVANNGIVTRASLKHAATGTQTAVKPKEVLKEITNANKVKTRLSNEFEKTEESLYSTALDETKSKTPKNDSKNETQLSSVSMVAEQMKNNLNLGNHEVPSGIDDFDKENWNDVYQVSHYAMDIFNYLKSREPLYDIPDYMDRQICLTRWMRSLLVDWMVEIQESFELNHETLYLGVKLVDMYLSRMTVSRDTLQLVGAASMFIASKYDERIPPLIDDFLYICDGAYNRRELIRMEINILKVCDFSLGMPLSYRFLRRYARCAKISMNVLTLARFILEYSLMDYATVTIRDSKLAAASLYLALQMKQVSGWTPALQFYSGYKLPEILSVVYLLNNGIQKKYKDPQQLMTVRNKYSHKIFFEVAKTPTLKNEELRP